MGRTLLKPGGNPRAQTNDPVHARYVRFYVDMGFDPQTARAFYAFTNAAAPADGLHIMTPQEIAHFRFAN
jgi:hypothetical protein